MGTRADFYIGRGPESKWIGSIAWDGYPDGMPPELFECTTESDFLSVLAGFLEREDATIPDAHNWPWPWEDSHITDYTYAFDDARVWISNSGYAWKTLEEYTKEAEKQNAAYERSPEEGNKLYESRRASRKHCSICNHDADPSVVYPERGGKKQGDIFGPRSGVIVFGVRD